MDSQDAGQETYNNKYLGTEKHMKRGLSLFKTGEYQRAIKHFDAILLHDKNYVRAYNNLGYIHRILGNYEKALQVWEAGLKIDPSYKRLHENISGLRRFLKAEHEKSRLPVVRIEDFQSGVDWLSESAELAEIREGRFFDTYIIEDDDGRYAFRTPGEPLSRNQKALEAFERASSSWRQLSVNKHILKAYSLERISGRPFLALEYAPDGSLLELLNQPSNIAGRGMTPSPEGGGVRLSLSQILDFALQVCLGMRFIEAEIGVHGSLRLENLLLCKRADGDGHGERGSYLVKIADIGQWAVFDRQELFCDSEGRVNPELAERGLVRTPGGFLTASLYTCAPELVEAHHEPDGSTDIYAFGIVFYEMLTGIPLSELFADDTVHETTGEGLGPPSKIRKSIPPSVSAICMRCLERDPAARYRNFSEIAESIIQYVESTKDALADLNELCRRYKKVSKFQFRDEERNTSMMIVGGTEFSTETDQLWEVLKRRAQAECDEDLMERLKHIEGLLVAPELSIGELYPVPATVAESLSLIDLENYREGLSRLSHAQKDSRSDNAEIDETVSTAAPAESPADESQTNNYPHDEVFGPSISEEYSSLLQREKLDDAAHLLADAVEFRAVVTLSESLKGNDLLTAFETVRRSELFYPCLRELFRELSATHAIPSPEDFLWNGMSMPAGTITKLAGLLMMAAGEFAAALETFGMFPGEQYLAALNIYVWAMAKFQSNKMEEIRLRSLRNGSNLLKEALMGDKNLNGQGTNSVPSPLHGGDLRDALFLRALILNQLGEYKRAISHFQAYKKVFDTDPALSREKLPWADIVLGECMCNCGLPSEGFMRWRRVLTEELPPPFFAFLELGSTKPSAFLATQILESCEQAISKFAENSMLWCIKGKLMNCLASCQDAVECTNRALEIDEDFYPAYYVRMEALTSAGRFEESLEALKVCSLREPYDPMLMLREAEILCRMEEPEKALVELKRGISYGLELSELRLSIDKERLTNLRKFDEFVAIMADLDRV